MSEASSVAKHQRKFSVRRNLRTVRDALRRVRNNDRLTTLCLFGGRTPQEALDHVERLASSRDSVQMPVYLVPVTFDGQYAHPIDHGGTSMLAVTRDVSLRGLGFIHDEPLHGDYAIVTFDLLGDRPVSLLLSVRWRNLRRGSAYLSGGRFLAICETPDF